MASEYFTRLDKDRSWRVRELSDIRSMHARAANKRDVSVLSRSAVVLSYAHWEGYCSGAVNTYLDFILSLDIPINALPAPMKIGGASNIFDSYRDSSDTTRLRLNTIEKLQSLEYKKLSEVILERKVFLPRSNLNYDRLSEIFQILALDVTPFTRHRLKIDKELVKRRHDVAHGQDIELAHHEIEKHTHFCDELMLLMQNAFYACLNRHM